MIKLKIKTNYSDDVLTLELPANPVRHKKLTADSGWAEVLPKLQSFSGMPTTRLAGQRVPEVLVFTEEGSLVGRLIPMHEATAVLPFWLPTPSLPHNLAGWWFKVERVFGQTKAHSVAY